MENGTVKVFSLTKGHPGAKMGSFFLPPIFAIDSNRYYALSMKSTGY
ncbi:MAG: hypothetical protein ACFE9R_20180 [Candidatus Hermodarchaeota archaeon]